MKKKWIIIGMSVFFIAAGVGGVKAWKLYRQYRVQKEHREHIENDKNIRLLGDTSKLHGEDGKLKIPVDFQEVQEENSDIYAWITIPGVADAPIIQSSGNSENSIFTEKLNSKDFSDPLTVIYGTNMEDGSLFGGLFQYRDRQFMEEHPRIYIYTPEKALVYKIFAAYRTDNRHLLRRFNRGKYEGNIKAFIKDILSQRAMDSTVDQDAPIDINDYFLTLSTHDPEGEEYRYLVQAYLEESFT